MNSNRISLGLAVLALSGAATLYAVAQPGQPAGQAPAKAAAKEGDDEEVVIKLADAPEGVRNAAAKLAAADKIKRVTKEEGRDHVYVYEVEYTADGVDCSADLSAAGDIMEIEKGVKESAIPAAALSALKKKYPKASFKGHVMVQKFYYEVDVVTDGKSREIKVDAAGNVHDEHAAGAEGHEEHEEHEGNGEKPRK